MFNLETAIAEWRRQMLAAGIKQGVALDELQEHLRSDIELQMKSGIQIDKAFANAVERFGTGKRVGEEFTKVRPRLLMGFEPWITAVATFFVLSTFATSALSFSILKMSVAQQIVGFTGIGLILTIGLGWRQFISRVPVVKNQATRWYLYVLCFASAFLVPAGLAWLMESRLDPASNSYAVGMIWACLPMPLLICLAVSFTMDRTAREHWGMGSRNYTSSNKEQYV
jgi:hypothetical protein